MKVIRAALALACATGVAQADVAANDIKTASSLNVNSATVIINGVEVDVRLGTSLTKPANSLTFDIPATALGIPITGVSVHAIGSDLGGGKVYFQTANNYKPGVALPDGTTLTSEFGSFTMQARSLAGADAPLCAGAPCAGGTSFALVGGSIVLGGSFGSRSYAMPQAHGVGGVARAKLGRLVSPPQHLNANGAPELPVCSGATETRALMKIALGAAAPTGGARVDLSSTATGLRFARTVNVAPGSDTAAVEVSIPASYVGIASITAAAGGLTGSATLDVKPASACVMPPRKYALERIGSCVGCTAFGSLNSEGDRIIALDGIVNFLHAGTATPLAKLFGASAVAAGSINNAGQIAGRLTRDGVTQAYRADMRDGAHQPVLLGGMVPMGISPGGTVVGYRVDPTTGKHIPVVNRGGGIADLSPTSPYGVAQARALFMLPDATIVGTYTGNDGVVRGYRYANGATTTLAAIGGNWPLPVGVTAAGSIAVNVGSSAAVIAKSGAVTLLGSPASYSSFVAKDINKWGYVVGTATCTTCTSSIPRAFVWIPGTGFKALSGYVSTLSYADDALAINDDNQIAVHGQLAGATYTDTYLLSL